MSRLGVTFACQQYDRMQALADGTVEVRGVDLNFLPLPVEETFYRMMRFREFDAAEMSLSSFLMTAPDGPFVAIPVFPSRSFRHSGVYVREDSTARTPGDLTGGRIGVPEFQMTAAVWIRGIFEERHGLPMTKVSYRTGGLESPGRTEKVELSLPAEFDVVPLAADRTLTQALIDGEIDALYSARTPSAMGPAGPLRRLFDDPESVEQQYLAGTGIFPIMHVVVIRRDVYERQPWLAQELYRACSLSKEIARAKLSELAALTSMLPWPYPQDAFMQQHLGADWWSYGYEANAATLETFTRYSRSQGLAVQAPEPAHLFAPETLETFVI
ncbi:ABC transporter substrate-binding protein [Pseudonocardia halophobica]|uniref:4,5-dihydroxyphthalate decarboxylase n=1 Tax=Pseudonocardia halophobica TaxID=29401 RepID=A0A9W6L9P1_9PSEU|nr:4,5-dihydroxyphthalate decarboxylase [Pseudonocardia halophobica]GLL14494.1 4,5-dihydroxyphthalate decarboxylase [Pseudonocardia halophobica]